MVNRTVITAGAGVLASVVIVTGVAAFANAADPTNTIVPAASATASATASASPTGGADRGPGGGSQDTPVTGTELTKVTAAVKAKDSAVTVTSVRKDPDGSYDVFATKAGAQVMLEVSKDLGTITERTGGPGGHGGRGPGGGSQDTPVTGTELTKVTAAVKAKDSAVTVTSVRKDPDGSYDVFGTKAGAQVMLEVSKDLGTISERTGGPGGHGGAPSSTPSSSPTTSSTTTAAPSSTGAA